MTNTLAQELDDERSEENSPEVGLSSVERLLKLPIPEGMTRPETGPMQFGDDWPGVFIRGDNAAYYARAIDILLWGDKVDPVALAALGGLNETLKSSSATSRQRP